MLYAFTLACDEPSAEPAFATATPAPELDPTTVEVKAYVDAHVTALSSACEALCAAAPAPSPSGWSVASHPSALAAMRARWREARVEYERIEGAIAVLFPELDQVLDGRYEREVELRADPQPFDGQGFVGMHAVERILFADAPPPEVVAFERALPHYAAPRTPQDEAEARAFRDELCGRLVRDVRLMEAQLAPLALDPQTAYRGIQGSIEEQAEKVLLGATGQDESRYARHTLADMRANLEGGRAILAAYRGRIEGTPAARALAPALEARLEELARAYAALEGDALPTVPEGFDPDAPSAAHLRTPYGRLFALLGRASDPEHEGSLAALLRAIGEALGIPPLGR